MSPVFTGSTHSCLGLINNELNSFVWAKFSQLSEEIRSCHLITNWADRFNDNSSDMVASTEHLSDVFEASIFFCSVFVLVLSHWELQLWEGCSVMRSSQFRITMMSIIKGKDGQAVWINTMVSWSVEKSYSYSKLIWFCGSTSSKMDLWTSLWTMSNDLLSQNISQIMGW